MTILGSHRDHSGTTLSSLSSLFSPSSALFLLFSWFLLSERTSGVSPVSFTLYLRPDQPTDGLTWVGARDTCVSKKLGPNLAELPL